MQAILKERHTHFCRLVKEICINRSLPVSELEQLEAELCALFQNYQERLSDIRLLIHEYKVKQKAMQQKVKKLIKEDAEKKHQLAFTSKV